MPSTARVAVARQIMKPVSPQVTRVGHEEGVPRQPIVARRIERGDIRWLGEPERRLVPEIRYDHGNHNSDGGGSSPSSRQLPCPARFDDGNGTTFDVPRPLEMIAEGFSDAWLATAWRGLFS